jgi:predicted nucleotidyltransferase
LPNSVDNLDKEAEDDATMTDETLEEKLRSVLVTHPEIVFAVLYGSAAEGDRFNDVDVALLVDRQALPQAQDLDFIFQLADSLENHLSVPVDVRILNEAPLPYRYNVSKGKPLLVRDKERWYTFLERTWDEYLDFQPVAMQYIREMI